MSLATAELPTDPAALRAFALACQDELRAAELAVQYKTLEIEKLKFQIAKLRRMQFGRSSERINHQIAQLELRLEELEAGEAEDVAKAEAANPAAPARARNKPTRKPLPDHLPRQEVIHQPAADGACTCPACGRGMSRLGEDITEVLDYVPGHFQVIRHVRPKYACDACDAITQAPAPAMPTPRGRTAPGLLAHLLVGKYCDHLPLYRQAEIYAREGLDLDRSTLCDWVGQAAWLLDPVVAGIQQHVFAGAKIHGDDTTVPVLTPGLGRTKTGRLWVYVRDDRPFCGDAPPAAAYFYSPDRGGERPAAHMAGVNGFLQADGYTRVEALYPPPPPKPGPIIEGARRHIWLGLPASSRPMATPGSRRCIIPPAPSQARSSKLPAGRTAGARSSTCGSRRSRQLPRRRSIASPRSISSRTRPGSPLSPSGLNTASRRRRCSRHSGTCQ